MALDFTKAAANCAKSAAAPKAAPLNPRKPVAALDYLAIARTWMSTHESELQAIIDRFTEGRMVNGKLVRSAVNIPIPQEVLDARTAAGPKRTTGEAGLSRGEIRKYFAALEQVFIEEGIYAAFDGMSRGKNKFRLKFRESGEAVPAILADGTEETSFIQLARDIIRVVKVQEESAVSKDEDEDDVEESDDEAAEELPAAAEWPEE